MIELNPLRYFISAFETKTFSQAARENGVSQPTVSAAIQRLEDRLGAALFQRFTEKRGPSGDVGGASARHVTAGGQGPLRS